MSSQVQPVQFELSRHILKKVASAIKFDERADASWLKIEFIRPSTEYGVPITVDSDDPKFFRIQNIWATAVQADPTIKDEGALILKARRKDGTPVSAIDPSKYHVPSDAVQSNVTAEPARHPSLSNLRGASPLGASKAPKLSPTAVTSASNLRSSASPEVPDNTMMHDRVPHAGEIQKPDGMASILGSNQQNARRAPGCDTEASEAPRRRRAYSGSTVYSPATTTVTFQANITTGPNIVAVPFDLDNINESIDDIVAYVDWKNSEVGRASPVDFKTFLSIMRFRPIQANAVVLRKAE
ncbi:zygote arrest protein 1 [Diplodia corticola]|uniref:Zygote arrest protein 1 n=1 Tax=Diplodia corticola TaxID=236234 RepID=A0A1J9RLR6_9PEZI|nr:zygote arrest protein 1 [Diplodia corticola]OJD33515.1 zygote arrest protein 1 [Diplodia corticola]